MLSVYTNTPQTDWDEYLPHVTFAYSTLRQHTTKMTPFSVVYAREAVLPTEILLTHIIRSEDIQQNSELYSTYAMELKFLHPSEMSGEAKNYYCDRWFEPYTIVRKQGEVNDLVQMGPNKNSKIDVRPTTTLSFLFLVASETKIR